MIKVKFFYTLILSVLMLSVNAQFRKIPSAVTDAFTTRYSNATHVTWKDKVTSFKAEFRAGSDSIDAYFSSKGEFIKSEKYTSSKSLSKDIKDGISKSKYADWGIKEVVTIEDKNGIQYRILVQKEDKQKRYLYFTPAGQLKSDSITL